MLVLYSWKCFFLRKNAKKRHFCPFFSRNRNDKNICVFCVFSYGPYENGKKTKKTQKIRKKKLPFTVFSKRKIVYGRWLLVRSSFFCFRNPFFEKGVRCHSSYFFCKVLPVGIWLLRPFTFDSYMRRNQKVVQSICQLTKLFFQ